MDWVLEVALLLEGGLGFLLAVTYRWGSLWYLHTVVPWLSSLALFRPDATPILPLPLAVRVHMINAFVLILLFPFTRLVHIFTFPARYLLRHWQLVWWNRVAVARPANRVER